MGKLLSKIKNKSKNKKQRRKLFAGYLCKNYCVKN